MEIWDILDEDGNPTGRTMRRGDAMGPGEYYLAVHIWIRDGDGMYLIQKRADDKPLWPGYWAVTGGAALAGESSREAALREVREEIGISADPERLAILSRLKRWDWFTDIYLLEQAIPLESVVLQTEEVSAVRWATGEEIRSMVAAGEFVNYSYINAFLGHERSFMPTEECFTEDGL